MVSIVQYVHDWGQHSAVVSVIEENVGMHKANCLCFQRCRFFHPNELNNCAIAQSLYDLCVANDVVTPVWECAMYEPEEE